MLRLLTQILGLVADVVVGWLVPLVGIAILMPVMGIIIAANPTVGGVITAVLTAVISFYHIRNRMWWQLGVIGGILVPLIIMTIFAPAGAILWTFFVQSIALGLLFIVPGAVLPSARRIISTWLIVGVIITTVLTGVVRTGGEVLLALLGLIAIGGAAMFLSRAARPWEIRRTQRRVGRLLAALGIALVMVGLIYNWRPTIAVTEPPQAFKDAWVIISAPLHRRAMAEEQKTIALDELKEELLDAHWERFRSAFEEMKLLPLTEEEWEELGIPRQEVERDP